jgi:hypothetical protein
MLADNSITVHMNFRGKKGMDMEQYFPVCRRHHEDDGYLFSKCKSVVAYQY